VIARVRRVPEAALRLNRLAAFGLDRLLWSRLLPARPRRPAGPMSPALLATKAIRKPPPELTVSGASGRRAAAWTSGFAAVHAALFLNLQAAGGTAGDRYAHPSPAFRAIYLWDSAFIAQIWTWWDPEVAWDVLRAVVERRDGDRLQHFAGDFGRSTLTQPPLIAWSLERLGLAVAAGRHAAWTRELYGPLCAYHRWLAAHRRLENGLYAWAHPYESGVENAPRFSSRDERRLEDTRRLAAPDFSAYMVLKCEALAAMARRLGRGEDAGQFDREADALRAAINRHLWHEEEGLYFDRDATTGAFVKSRTIASLLPLWAGVPSPAQAERLHAHVLAPESFNTVIPLPSVALADRDFEKDMWRGPVWVNLAYAVIEGLRRYGLHETAADLAFRLCDGVYRTFRNTGHFHEFYDPERFDVAELRRKRGNRWKRLTLGARPLSGFVGWSGLVNTLVVDVLFGLRRTEAGLIVQPRFPPRAEGLVFSLTLPREDLVVRLRAAPGGSAEVTVRQPAGERRFDAAFGAVLPLGTQGGRG
jgi:hypothetical protein